MPARCPHCPAAIPKSPNRLLRWAAVAGAWMVILAMLMGLSLAALFAVPLVPLVVLAGAALVSAAHEYAFGDRICEACDRAYELDGVRIEVVELGTGPASALAA